MTGDTTRARSTAGALRTLPGTWRALHDVRHSGRLALPHDVLVGPGGVFVVSCQTWPGRVGLVDGVLAEDGTTREPAVHRVAEAAMAVWERVPGLDPHAVVPVLCLQAPEPPSGWARDVLVCTPENLGAALAAHPLALGPAEVDHVYDVLRDALPAADTWHGPTAVRRRARTARVTAPRARRAKVRHQPWEPYSEVTPQTRALIVGLLVCMIICALTMGFVLPAIDVVLTALFHLF